MYGEDLSASSRDLTAIQQRSDASFISDALHSPPPAGWRCQPAVFDRDSGVSLGSPPGCVLVLLCAWLLGCRREAEPGVPEPTPVLVRCVPPKVERLSRTVPLSGTVQVAPTRHALVAPQVAGRLTAVLLREGDAVHRGEPVAEVDARPARDALTQTRAALAGARAAAENAAITKGRTERLFEHGIAARQEVDDAAARLAVARAQATAASATVDVAARNLSYATVRAPLDGVVLRTLRAPGDLVDGTPATPVVEIGDPTALELLSSAVPADLIKLSPGQRGLARFEALPGRTFPVSVRSIAPAIDLSSGVGAVRLSLVAGPGAPPIGLAGEADVDVGAQPQALTLPETTLRGTPEGGTEVLVCDDGHLRAQQVQVGARTNGRVELLAPTASAPPDRIPSAKEPPGNRSDGKDGTPELAPGTRVVEDGVLGLASGAAYKERP